VFASIRRYRMNSGSLDELVGRVDEGLAEKIAIQPGFVSYEFIDCGGGDMMTISLFNGEQRAETSRELADLWTLMRVTDLDYRRTESRRGEVMVSRAQHDALKPARARGGAKFATIRRYQLRAGDVRQLMHLVDSVFADQVVSIKGFEAYHAIDWGRGDIISVGLFRDQSPAKESDELALGFVKEDLAAFDIERTEVVGGPVCVSRAMAALLEPAHA